MQLVEKYQPAEENGIEFDLDSAQAANEAAEEEAAAAEGSKSSQAKAKAEPAPNLEPSTSLKPMASGSELQPNTPPAPSNSATDDPEKPPGAVAKFFADDGLFMRFIWWTLRTVFSFLIPLGMFYVLQKNPQLVDSAYKMIKTGIEPYPVLLKGGMAATIAILIASVPPLFGVWLASVLYRFKSLKPLIAFSIWFIVMFFFTTIFVVAARYFRII
ncbi:MAG: hypothetical protein DKT66_07820 [Candidatus Melainabacteria bacterium]|nr:MAG: hypothetical protein DKT66_07820 [Candidatus Melainabacteria bacterium]